MADGTQPATALDARAIADALRVSKRGAAKRAATEAWPFEEVRASGGMRRVYPFATLPEDVRKAITHARAIAAAQALPRSAALAEGAQVARRIKLAETVDAAVVQRQREAGQAAAAALTGKRLARMQAKLELLARLAQFRAASQAGTCEALDAFCDAYNSGALTVPVAVRNHTGADLHPATLRRWQKLVDTRGPVALAGEYGNRKGCGTIDATPALREFVLGVLVSKPHIRARTLHDLVRARMPQLSLARRGLERWLAGWKQDNASLFLSLTNPDAWKNKYMVAMGSYAEGITRANQQWMLDSTPADVQLIDGRHSILGVIDVATRRVIYMVSKTSTAEAVCQLMRRAMLEWGVPEAVKVDNGRDYASERVAHLLTGLGVDMQFSAPFSGWEKPFIERVFGTFTRHCLELLPGYSGHNVAEAQAIRARKSFAQRLEEGQAIEAKLTCAELQTYCDDWVTNFYLHEPHRGEGMDGLTPFEKLAQLRDGVRVIGDVRALDLLLGSGTLRTVTKKGVSLDKLTYIAPELGALVGQQVLVRRDDGDMGRVVVYQDDAFLCVAECAAVTGIDRMVVTAEAKRRQKEELKAARKLVKQAGKRVADGDLARELLDAKEREARTLTVLPTDNILHITPALEAAAEAAQQLAEWEAGDAQRREQREASLASMDRVVREHQRSDETAEQRFRDALDQLQQQRDGTLDELALRRLVNYQDTPEFQTRWDVFTLFGARGVDLPASYNALLPEDALFLTQSQGNS